MDSPSKQLLTEMFSRMVVAPDAELRKTLDERESLLEQRDREALEAAYNEHERVRKFAEQERLYNIEAEKNAREAQEARDLAEAHRKAIATAEAKQREQDVLKNLRPIPKVEAYVPPPSAPASKPNAESNAANEQKTESTLPSQSSAPAQGSSQISTSNAAKPTVIPAPKAAASTPTPPSALVPAAPITNGASKPSTTVPAALTVAKETDHTSAVAEREAIHGRYLQLHAKLKEFRAYMKKESLKSPVIKEWMGDKRREMGKTVGQLTEGKGANAEHMRRVKALLIGATQAQQPMVDVRQFLVSPPEATEAEAQFPSLLIYLLNQLSKRIIKQFLEELYSNTSGADPIATLAISMFAQEELQWKGRSLIDILLAKYHKLCPVLWGVYGNEKTVRGRERLGWSPDLTVQRHGERMTALGAGFAALTLRDFSKARLTNPLPSWHFWRAVAHIINTPPSEATETHFFVLKSLVENSVEKFIKFYGQAALVALRKALVEFPAQSKTGSACNAAAVLPHTLKREMKLTL